MKGGGKGEGLGEEEEKNGRGVGGRRWEKGEGTREDGACKTTAL